MVGIDLIEKEETAEKGKGERKGGGKGKGTGSYYGSQGKSGTNAETRNDRSMGGETYGIRTRGQDRSAKLPGVIPTDLPSLAARVPESMADEEVINAAGRHLGGK